MMKKVLFTLLVSYSLFSYSQTTPVRDCDNISFNLIPTEKYIVSAWVKEEHGTQQLTYLSTLDLGFYSESFSFTPSGKIIDGWQRITGVFVVPNTEDDVYIDISLVNRNNSGGRAYFDDIRVHPFNGNLKSFVYDPETQRLMAELDENNYATFYEYDQEGGLIRVKKETERGVMTIQETRSGNTKISN